MGNFATNRNNVIYMGANAAVQLDNAVQLNIAGLE